MQEQIRIALIPAYEPEEGLPELAKKMSLAGFEVLVVDDGSGESFRSVFDKTALFASVLTHEINKGKGSALKTGLSYIAEKYPQGCVVVTVDADGQHSVEDAIRVCDAASENRNTLVLGCRSFKDGTPLRSLLGNTITKLVFRFSTGIWVSDTQTGLRAFSSELMPFLLDIGGERYEYEMNVLLECSRQQIDIKEVKIKTIYIDNNTGSHFSTVKDSFRIYREILKFAASSFTAFLVDYGMYSLFSLLTAGLGSTVSVPLSNVSARLVSATVNYNINKNLVFKCRGRVKQTAAQYFALAAVILLGNTLLVSFLTNSAGINKYLAKILTELVFLSLSWIAQKHLIFRKRKAPEREKRN